MPISNFYNTWFQRIQILRPGQPVTQLRNFVWLVVGIYQSRSVCLSRIAGKIPGSAQLVSLTRRLSLFLDNPREIYETYLLIHWQHGEPEPWCLATNLPDQRLALQAYRRRMWTEEMFGDLKRHGFDLESTILRHTCTAPNAVRCKCARRLSRLTLAVALLYLWCMATGTRGVRTGQRHLVDRKDRRDLSVFQIGLRLLERQLINGLSVQFLLFC